MTQCSVVQILHSSGIDCFGFFGDEHRLSPDGDDGLPCLPCGIVVCTVEKAERLLEGACRQRRVHALTLAVIDECQFVSDALGGLKYETLLAKLVCVNRRAQALAQAQGQTQEQGQGAPAIQVRREESRKDSSDTCSTAPDLPENAPAKMMEIWLGGDFAGGCHECDLERC